MAKSRLRMLLNATRRVLALQLALSVLAVALTAWALATVSELQAARTRLDERVIQLEGALASRSIVVPPPAPVVIAAQAAYPPQTGPGQTPQAERQQFDPRRTLSELFSPPPPLQRIVVHVRSEADRALAEQMAAQAWPGLDIEVRVTPPRGPWSDGYYYYDGRQNAPASVLADAFSDVAREGQTATWSAQLRGVALPARGEFSAGRLDVILPALPPPPPPEPAPAPAQP